jgi:hypothetical protein
MRIGELTRSGFRPASSADIDALRDHFSQHHYVRLDGLVEPWLLERWVEWSTAAPFRPRAHHTAAYWGGEPPPVDHVIDSSDVLGRMLFAMNDPALFRAIARVTACAAIGCFHGFVYRLDAQTGDRDRFHSDMNGNRLAALSINLGREPHRGGRVQLKERAGDRLLCELENTAFGGAILFELSESLRHRVSGVEPGPARTVFTGWFQREPSHDDWLRGVSYESSSH